MPDPNGHYRILHIVANYPDGVFQQATTEAVKNLIDATSNSLSHLVVSISRTMDPRKEFVVQRSNCLSISYLGFPAVIGQSLFIHRLAQRINKELTDRGWQYDLIHGHKLTVESTVAYYMSLEFGKPYMCTVRGLSDGKVLKWRLDRREIYAKVLEKSSATFLPAPWARKLIERYLKPGNHKRHNHINYVVMPNIVQFSQIDNQTAIAREPKFVTVFREGQGKRKGFRELLKGLVEARTKQKPIFLDVIGCGSDGVEAAWAREYGISDQVSFLGKYNNEETVRRVAQYRGFMLPTHNDTFGMVYTEALLAGVPVLYSAGTGIDGYLDDLDVGIRIDPLDQVSINHGILQFDENADDMGNRLKLLLEAGRFDFFNQTSISAQYCKEIKKVIEHAV